MSVERTEPPFVLPEREMLEQWLEYHRATLLWKCEGLDDEQLKTMSVPPSNLSLLGLVRHMVEVERNWFQRVMEGHPITGLYFDDDEPDGDFTRVRAANAADDLAMFERVCAQSRAIAAVHALDDTGDRRGEPCTLRWILVHMIEEYARHNGHADLLRERIDGSTGD